MAQSSAGVKATRPPQWLEVNGLRAVTELLLREKGKRQRKMEEKDIFTTCLLPLYLSYPMTTNKIKSTSTFPGLLPFSPKPACGIGISAMVSIWIMVFF